MSSYKKSIKTIRKRKLPKLFLFFAATQWSFRKFTPPLSADNTDLHSHIHSLILSDSNAVVLQGKVHQFNSNLVVSHEECQSNKPKKQSPWKHIQHDIKDVNMYKSFNGKKKTNVTHVTQEHVHTFMCF